MKIFRLFFLILVLPVSTFAQTSGEVFSLIGKADFAGKKEKARNVFPLEGKDQLLLISKNEARLWETLAPAIVYTSTHGIYKNQGFLSRLIKFPEFVILNPAGTKGLVIDKERGTDKDSVIVWDLQKGRKAAVLARPEKTARKAEFSADGEVLATVHGDLKDSEIAFWNSADHSYRSSVLIEDLAWFHLSPDGKKLYTVAGKAKKWLGYLVLDFENADGISVWNTKTGELKETFRLENINIGNRFGVSPLMARDGKYLAVETKDSVLILDADENLKLLYALRPKDAEAQIQLAGFTPDEKYFLIREEGAVKFHRLEDGEFVKKFPLGKDVNFELSRDNRFALIESLGSVAVFDIDKGETLYRISIRTNDSVVSIDDNLTNCDGACPYNVEFLKISPNNKYILLAGEKEIKVFDLATGAELQVFAHPQRAEYKKGKLQKDGLSGDAGWLGDGDLIYTADEDKKEYLIWKIK